MELAAPDFLFAGANAESRGVLPSRQDEGQIDGIVVIADGDFPRPSNVGIGCGLVLEALAVDPDLDATLSFGEGCAIEDRQHRRLADGHTAEAVVDPEKARGFGGHRRKGRNLGEAAADGGAHVAGEVLHRGEATGSQGKGHPCAPQALRVLRRPRPLFEGPQGHVGVAADSVDGGGIGEVDGDHHRRSGSRDLIEPEILLAASEVPGGEVELSERLLEGEQFEGIAGSQGEEIDSVENRRERLESEVRLGTFDLIGMREVSPPNFAVPAGIEKGLAHQRHRAHP